MSDTEENEEVGKELARVEQETGITPEQQIKAIQDGFANLHDLGNRLGDVLVERERTTRHLADAELADRNSRREYKLVNRQLDILEKVLTAHFAERKGQIEGGFRIIDKALAEGNLDKVTEVYSDMSAMVAKSPLAAAAALNNKMKSGKAITLDDF